MNCNFLQQIGLPHCFFCHKDHNFSERDINNFISLEHPLCGGTRTPCTKKCGKWFSKKSVKPDLVFKCNNCLTCVEELSKIKLNKLTESGGWAMLEKEKSCCPGDDVAFGWNKAREELERQKKLLK